MKAGGRTLRKVLLTLVLGAGLVVLAGSFTGYREDDGFSAVADRVRDWLAVQPGTGSAATITDGDAVASTVPDEAVLLEMRVRQRNIEDRLDQLTETVTTLNESVNRSQASNDTVISGLRREHQAGIEALESRVAELQRRLAAVAAKPVVAASASAVRPAAQAGKSSAPAQSAAGAKTEEAMTGAEWVVNVASSSREQAMKDLASRLKEQGIPVERQALTIEGDLMYRLRVPGFATSDTARNYASKLDKEHGLKGAWISRK
ncbi:MAG: SPOR domain-containing protein [Gammaproteobacteria bacterium]|jgi:cell division septation protein DedD